MHAIQFAYMHRAIGVRHIATSPQPAVGPSAEDASALTKGSEQ
jgi:hypothetical protein